MNISLSEPEIVQGLNMATDKNWLEQRPGICVEGMLNDTAFK